MTHEIEEKNGVLYSQQDAGLRIRRTAKETPEYSQSGATLEVFRTQTHSFESAAWWTIRHTIRIVRAGTWPPPMGCAITSGRLPTTGVATHDQIYHRFDKWVLSSVADNNFGTAEEPHTPNRLTFSYAYEGTYTYTYNCPGEYSSGTQTDDAIYVRAATLQRIDYGVGYNLHVDLTYDQNRDDRPAHYDDPGYQTYWTRQRLAAISCAWGSPWPACMPSARPR